jgi:Putative binding domain, N-terminal
MGKPRTRAGRGLHGRAVTAAVLIWAAAISSGCETSSTVSETSPSSVSKCEVSLSAPPMIDASGGRATLAVSTQPECAWTASSSATWITGVAPGSGQGARDVEFQVAPNPDTVIREGEIAVNDSRVRVAQRAACRYVLTPATQSVGASGGESSVTVAAGPECAWTATTDVGWIALSQPVSGTGNGTITFSAAANGTNERVGNIIVAGQRATVTQPALAPVCTYSISPASQNISGAGGPGTPISVSTQNDCRWTARSNDAWITVTSDSNGIGNGSATFSVAANTGAARTGTLTVASRTFTVSQAAAAPAACNYSIGPTSVNAAAGSATGTVNVTTTSACTWTATSNAPWITVTGGASGSGNGAVAYSIAANTGAARSGTVTIAGQAFTVNQAAAAQSCSYMLSPGTQQIDATGGVATVNVNATSGCAWTTTSSAAWLVITSGASGSGNGTVNAIVLPNTGGQRSATLTIVGQTATATVQQRAGN